MSSRAPDPPYRLDDLAKLANELGLSSERLTPDRLDVIVFEGCRLGFCNLPGENDTLVGFDGTPWHWHGRMTFLTCAAGKYADWDELDLLIGLGVGDVVVASLYADGHLQDRWLEHRDGPLALNRIRPGEEIRLYCLPRR